MPSSSLLRCSPSAPQKPWETMTSWLPLLLVCLSSTMALFCGLSLCVGSAISWDGHFNQQTENDSFSSVLDLVLNCVCFIYIGAWLPFDQFHISEIGITPWRLAILMLIILALRRIPSLLLLYKLIPEVADWREALFCGHFGPVSVFYTYKLCSRLTRRSIFFFCRSG